MDALCRAQEPHAAHGAAGSSAQGHSTRTSPLATYAVVWGSCCPQGCGYPDGGRHKRSQGREQHQLPPCCSSFPQPGLMQLRCSVAFVVVWSLLAWLFSFFSCTAMFLRVRGAQST